jgi:hypothetical protein
MVKGRTGDNWSPVSREAGGSWFKFPGRAGDPPGREWPIFTELCFLRRMQSYAKDEQGPRRCTMPIAGLYTRPGWAQGGVRRGEKGLDWSEIEYWDLAGAVASGLLPSSLLRS